jgi:hypothetical protein
MVPGCASSEGPAVSLMAEDEENHLPLSGLKIKYRINEGDWVPEIIVHDLPYVINGPAGKYEFELRKEGFPLRTLTVLVPQEGNCGIIQQELVLYAKRSTSCSTIPSVIVMEVISIPHNEDGLEIRLTPAGGFREPISCNNPNSCHFNIELNNSGDYVVEILGFQDHKDLMVIDDIVHYSYTNTTIEMSIGGNQFHTIVTEGISNIVLTIPYNYSDTGCYGVDFDKVSITREQLPPSAPNMFETMEKDPFTIGTIPSPSCPENLVGREYITMEYKVLLPAGTRTSDVQIQYFSEEGWKEATCYEIDGYTCNALYPNPFYGDQYQVRALIKDKELVGSNIALEDKCMLFD